MREGGFLRNLVESGYLPYNGSSRRCLHFCQEREQLGRHNFHDTSHRCVCGRCIFGEILDNIIVLMWLFLGTTIFISPNMIFFYAIRTLQDKCTYNSDDHVGGI